MQLRRVPPALVVELCVAASRGLIGDGAINVSEAYHIGSAAPDEWHSAFELALHHLGPELRGVRVANALELLRQGVIKPEGVFVARQAKALRCDNLHLLAGRQRIFWPPRTRPDNKVLAEDLVRHALHWLHRRGTKIAQALIGPTDEADAEPLLRQGFVALTRLNYLEHALITLPNPPASHLEYLTYSDVNAALSGNTVTHIRDDARLPRIEWHPRNRGGHCGAHGPG